MLNSSGRCQIRQSSYFYDIEFDEVIVATGVPRDPKIKGQEKNSALTVEVLKGKGKLVKKLLLLELV